MLRVRRVSETAHPPPRKTAAIRHPTRPLTAALVRAAPRARARTARASRVDEAPRPLSGGDGNASPRSPSRHGRPSVPPGRRLSGTLRCRLDAAGRRLGPAGGVLCPRGRLLDLFLVTTSDGQRAGCEKYGETCTETSCLHALRLPDRL